MPDTVVGSLSLDHSVDPNGSLVMTVPVRVPPAKLNPNLSVTHHSAVHEMSVLGRGWDLSAFGIIQRTTATVAQDGFAGSINFDSNDKFTLNGQRLIHIGDNEYRYEVEQWSKIVAIGMNPANPDSWSEYLPDGTVRLYGATNDSNIKALDQAATRIWALSETYDPFSNYASYIYTPESNGSYTVSSISYGGNRTLKLEHRRMITFNYEDRQDIQTEYVGGSAVTLTKRLASISASIDNALVYKHVFSYDYAPVTGWSRLQTIALVDASGSSVAPLTFKWSDASPAVFDNLTALESLVPDVATAQVIPMDVNGSGRTGLLLASSQYDSKLGGNALCLDVHLANGSGGIETTAQKGSGSTGLFYPTHLLAMDVNGDGKTDLLHIFSSHSEHTLTVLLSTEDGYMVQKSTTFSPDVLDGQYVTGDFEGNGDVGLVYIYNEIGSGGSPAVRLIQLTCDGISFTPRSPVNGPDYVRLSDVHVIVTDFNGNGADDVFLLSPTLSEDMSNVCEIDFFESQKGILTFRDDSPFAEVGMGISWTPSTSFLTLPEQDGKNGLLLLSQSSDSYLQFRTLRSTGKSFAVSDLTTTQLLYSGNVSMGRSTSLSSLDIINTFETTSGTDVAVLHFFNGSFISIDGVQQPPGSSLTGFNVNFADLRGIGRADCLFTLYDAIKSELALFSLPCAGTVAAPADFITSYYNGLGATTSVIYAPLTDVTVYSVSTEESGSATPYVNALSHTSTLGASLDPSRGASSLPAMARTRSRLVHFPKFVVKEMTSQASPALHPDIFSLAEYSYTNGRMSFDGRGWLGFETIAQTSRALETATTNTYIQEFPFVGQVSKTETREIAAPGNLVKVIAYTWDAVSANNSANLFTTIPTIHQTSYEAGAQSTIVDVTHTYDAYGNITETVIATPGKPSLTIASTYNNDASRWLIGSKTLECLTSDNVIMKQNKFAYLPGTQAANQIGEWITDAQWSSQDLSFDSCGNVTTATGPFLAWKTLAYDTSYTFPISVTTSVDGNASLIQRSTYDLVTGQALSTTEPNGYTKAQKYDVLGRVIEISEGDGSSDLTVVDKRQYTFIESSPACVQRTLCELSSDSWAKVTTYLDGSERPWKKAVPNPSDPSLTTYAEVLLDGAGRIIRQYRNYTSKTSTPAFSSVTYDTSSRKVKCFSPAAIADTDDITITYKYSYGDGQTLVSETKAGGGVSQATTTQKVVECFPNADGQEYVVPLTVCTTNELGQSVRTTFDALHRVTTVTDPKGTTLTQRWDGLSRQTFRQISSASAKHITQFSVQYDDMSNQTIITNDLSGSKTVLEKDRMNRPTKKKSPEDEVTLVYDIAGQGAQGRLASVISSNGVAEILTYDTRGCLSTSSLTIDGRTFDTAFGYTPSRELNRITNPDGSVLSKTRFENSETVEQVTLSDGSSALEASTTFSDFSDAFFSPLRCETGNGLKSTTVMADNGAPVKASISKDGSIIHEQAWELNGYGRLDSYRSGGSNGAIRSYEYDLTGQVIASQTSGRAQAATFSYDESGNILSKDGKTHVNNGWQLSSVLDSTGGLDRSFQYSIDGHLTSETDASGALVRSMVYDSEGRMLNLNGTTFVYDYKDRVIKASRSDGSVTYYPTESYEVTIQGDETIQTSYLVHHHRQASITTLLKAGQPVGSPTVNYYHGDHLGSTVAVSDAEGDIVTTYEYDAFGEVTVTGPDISRYKYSGKELFEGLYYFGARFYDPQTGRFTALDNFAISLDGIAPSTFNQYTFSRNNPINFIDFNGNISFWWHLAWHLLVDVALIATGIVAAVLLPGAPMLSEALIGAGVSGLMYDVEAGITAAITGKQELSDAAWGVALGTGALFSLTGFAGSAAASKAGFASIEAADLLGARVAGKFVASEVSALAKRGAVQLTVSAINGAASSATQKLLTNLVTDKDPWDGVAKAGLTGFGSGAASGVLKGAKAGAKAMLSGKKFFYDFMRDAESISTSLPTTKITGIKTLSYRVLGEAESALERNASSFDRINPSLSAPSNIF